MFIHSFAGAAVNITLAASKLFVGYTASSSALIADGVHSLSDLVSDFVTGIVLLSSRKPADADHPYGHGKFEAVGTLAISGLLLGASFGLALQSYTSILDVAQIWLADTAAAPSQSVAPNLGVAFGVAVVSVAAKEALYQWTHAVGVKARSQVCVSVAFVLASFRVRVCYRKLFQRVTVYDRC